MQKVGQSRVAGINQEGMIPRLHNMPQGDLLDIAVVHDHALRRGARGADGASGQGHFKRVAVAVQVPALAVVAGNAMAGVEFQSAGDLHKRGGWVIAACDYITVASVCSQTRYNGHDPEGLRVTKLLSETDHSRDSAGLTYVYPVVSRRAGGVSVGINLNPNNACNWRCIYCQVPDLKRGSAPKIDLDQLEADLRAFLHELLFGNFMRRHVPAGARRINDIALSGNGEPTSAKEFAQVIERIGKIMAELDLLGRIGLVLISNCSLIQRSAVRQGLKRMAELGGEVWFKLDSATAEGMRRINGTRISPQKMLENLRSAASLCPTWLQTCVFALDGQPPSPAERAAYLMLIRQLVAERVPLRGVLLYRLARSSLRPEAARLSPLPGEWLQAFAAAIEQAGAAVRDRKSTRL